jgi:multidrug resistance efflux pump
VGQSEQLSGMFRCLKRFLESEAPMCNANIRRAPLACAGLMTLLLLSACSGKLANTWSGYAEGDYVYITSALAGRLQAVAVKAGASISQNDPLFTLEAQSEQFSQREVAARVKAAQAQANNLDIIKEATAIKRQVGYMTQKF